MKVLFCTNIPSPYRVAFFNELGKRCELTVCYERKTASDRDQKWKADKQETYVEHFLNLKPVGADRSKGSALRKFVSSHVFDVIIFTNYVSLATMEAILYCRIKHIPYWVEYDGGFPKDEFFLKKLFKKVLLKGAKGHFSTSDTHINYLVSLGINRERIFKYPFTSLNEADLKTAINLNESERQETRDYHPDGFIEDANSSQIREIKREIYKKKLGVKKNDTVILFVGQFIHRKGLDILLKAFEKVEMDFSSIQLFLVGGDSSSECVKQAEAKGNVHIVGFCTKEEIIPYYLAADLFVLPTREDIWGLVINEAMSFGLPIVTTDKCVAGLELIKDGENGYIVPSENPDALSKAITNLTNDREMMGRMGNNNHWKIGSYTIEKMAEKHMDVFKEITQ